MNNRSLKRLAKADRRHGSIHNTPRRLTQRELDLIHKLANCQFAVTPREFETKWDETRTQMAALCHCSTGSVKCWFKNGRDYTAPNQYHLRYLAITDPILDYFDEIPPELLKSILQH